MSIISVFEDVLDRQPEKALSGYKIIKKDTRIFKVKTDSVSTTPKDIYDHADIPDINDVHPDDSALYCTAVTPRRKDDRKIWEVVCTYEQKQPTNVTDASSGGNNASATEGIEDPCALAPSVNWAFQSRQIVAEKCYSYSTGIPALPVGVQGAPTYPIRNSAGDPFDPPIMAEEHDLIITITKNVRVISPAVLAALNGTLNSAAVTVGGKIIAQYEGLLKIEAADLNFDTDGRPYRQMKYAVHVRAGGHYHSILDAGFRYLKSGKITDIYMSDINTDIPAGDKQDRRIQDPAKLNGSGGLTGTATYINFLTHWAADWKPLALPTQFDQPFTEKTKNKGKTTN